MAISNIDYMFQGCTSLKEIEVFNLPIDADTTHDDVLSGCSNTYLRAWDTEGNIWKSWGFSLTASVACTAPLDFYDLGTVNATTGLAGLTLKNNYKTALNATTQTSYYGYEPGKLFPFPIDTELSLASMFYNMQNMPFLDVSDVNFSKVHSLYCTFKDCYSLAEIRGFNASMTLYDTGLYEAFSGARSLKELDASNWNTEAVTTLFATFYNCYGFESLNVSNWCTPNVTTLYQTFFNCYYAPVIDVSSFDTSNVTSLYQTFYHCKYVEVLDVSNWDTSNITSMYQTFDACTQLGSLDLSGWDTSKITAFNNCFSDCRNLREIIGIENLDVGNATTLDSIMWGCSLFPSIDLSNWNTSKNTSWRYAFGYNESSMLTSVDLSGIDVSAVTTTEGMFDQQSSSCVVKLPQALFNKMATADKGAATFIIADV